MSASLLEKSVLVVEHGEDCRELMEMWLQNAGAHVRSEVSVPAALKTLQTWIPDVVLTDIAVPGTDGFQFVRALRGDPRTRGLVVIAVTGYGVSRTTAAAGGFDALLLKPCDFPTVEQTMLRLMARRAPRK